MTKGYPKTGDIYVIKGFSKELNGEKCLVTYRDGEYVHCNTFESGVDVVLYPCELGEVEDE